ASINATAKPGAAPLVTPANATSQPQQLRRENALPVPGKGNTPAAPVATAPTTAAPSTVNPNAKGANPKLTTPTATMHEEKLTNPAAAGKPAVTSTQPGKPEEHDRRTSTTSPAQTPAKPVQTLAKPEVRPVATPPKPAPSSAPPRVEAKRVATPPPPPPKP